MSAWRPYDNLICGELDNTQPGKVTGWLRFVGKAEDVTLDLEGDFHRDIRGTVIRIHNPEPAERRPGYMDRFANHHTGRVGDITAGLEPRDYVEYPYLEFYSDQNGRIVLELDHEQLQVIGTPRPWREEMAVSREEQQRNLLGWLSTLSAGLGGVPSVVVGDQKMHATSAEAEAPAQRPEQGKEHTQEEDHEHERSR
jgi:hypothetical protein